ncbi:MAG TPA: hypothetical protein VNC78_10705 [Actinomycetota bacterium]|nr:hypothetical protein [Actinomycetota bacterium]
MTDEPALAIEAEYALSSGLATIVAEDARAAWAKLRDIVPIAMIVDLQTGSAGGFALCRDLRADDRLRDVPVLMLIDRIQDGWLARQAGASAVCTKPIGTADLARTITELISRTAVS